MGHPSLVLALGVLFTDEKRRRARRVKSRWSRLFSPPLLTSRLFIVFEIIFIVFSSAATAFNCGKSQVFPFTEQIDPYNPGNVLEGFQCRFDGPNFGSLFITKVNGEYGHV